MTEEKIFQHKIMTKKRFSLAVENLVADNPDVSYIDAGVMIIEERGMQYQSLKKLLTDSLRDKIEHEANTLNLIRGARETNKLPI